jgi:hypothetical protein
MNFAADQFTFQRIPSRLLLSEPGTFRGDQSPLRNKIVILGGEYLAGRDQHPTPDGLKSGMELHARAIDTELRNLGIRHANEVLLIAVDLIIATFLVYLNWRFDSPQASRWNLVAVGVLALFASFVTFHTLSLWVNFAIILVGVWLHNQFNLLHELHELRGKVKDLGVKAH